MFSTILLQLIVFFLPSQLGLHFWPEFSRAAGIKIDYLSPTLYLSDLLVICLVLVTRRPRFSRTILLLLLLIFANILFSLSPFLTFYKFSRLFLYLALYLYLTQHTPLFLKLFPFVFPWTVLWTSLLAVWQFFAQTHLGGLWFWIGERPLNLLLPNVAKISLGNLGLYLRPYATFSHPNALAGFLSLGLLLLLYLKNRRLI